MKWIKNLARQFSIMEKKLKQVFLTEIVNYNGKLIWQCAGFIFDVDFEMYGKTESAILSNKICRSLGKNTPNVLPMNYF